jgi:hypothetical protein
VPASKLRPIGTCADPRGANGAIGGDAKRLGGLGRRMPTARISICATPACAGARARAGAAGFSRDARIWRAAVTGEVARTGAHAPSGAAPADRRPSVRAQAAPPSACADARALRCRRERRGGISRDGVGAPRPMASWSGRKRMLHRQRCVGCALSACPEPRAASGRGGICARRRGSGSPRPQRAGTDGARAPSSAAPAHRLAPRPRPIGVHRPAGARGSAGFSPDAVAPARRGQKRAARTSV